MARTNPMHIRQLHVMGKSKSEKDLISMVNVVDDDNSGTIRYREYVNLMLIEEGILKEPIMVSDYELLCLH